MAQNRIQLSRDTKNAPLAKDSRRSLKPAARKINEEGLKSQLGYSEGSYYKRNPYIDVNTPNGVIDMNNTAIPLYANGQLLMPHSGQYQFDTKKVREIPADNYQDMDLSPEEIAHYRSLGYFVEEAPAESKFQTGGVFQELDLTPQQIKDYESRGYRVERL